MKKKIIALLGTAVILTVSCFTTTVNAYSSLDKYASSFKDDWEKTTTLYAKSNKTSKVAKMVYGYETWAWDEDYVWTYGYSSDHQASLLNSKGVNSGNVEHASRWSKIEVHHKSAGEVEYTIWVEKSFLSHSTSSSNEK